MQLVDPEFELNDVPVAFELVEAFTDGLNRSLDASNLEEQGILLRLLELEVSRDRFEAIAFVRVESLDFIE